MPLKRRRVVSQHLDRAVNSIRLAIEHFNRPFDQGRPEAVVHFALHAHEMLSKAVLLHRGKRIQDRRSSKTISFAKAMNLLDDTGEKVLDAADKVSLLSLSNVRDAAQHSIVEISEQELFLHAQATVTVFDRVLTSEFGEALADHLPQRVLPVSTTPPESLELLVDTEVSQIKELLKPGRRRTVEARPRLRALLAMDLAAADEQRLPTPLEVDRASKRLKDGRRWQDVLPNLAALSLDASGTGQTYSVRLTKESTAPPVRFAESEDDFESAAIMRDVDVTERFPFSITRLAKLVGVTVPKAGAVAWKVGLKDDPESYHVIQIDQSQHPRYSHKALEQMRDGLARHDLDAIWAEYKSRDQP